MIEHAEKQYKKARQQLEDKIKTIGSPNPRGFFLRSSTPVIINRKKCAISDFIRAVDRAQSEKNLSFERLTAVLNRTCDLLDRRLDFEEYNRIAEEMLAPVNPRGVVGICSYYFSWAVFLLAATVLFTGPVFFGLLGLVSSYFLQDLGDYVDNKLPKQENALSPLAYDMKAFSRVLDECDKDIEEAERPRPVNRDQDLQQGRPFTHSVSSPELSSPNMLN